MLCFVRSVDLDGGDRQVEIADADRPKGITIYEEYVYWISECNFCGDWIQRADRLTGLDRQVIFNSTETMDTLRVNHPSKQPAGWYTTPI